jgi:hypothetical protein
VSKRRRRRRRKRRRRRRRRRQGYACERRSLLKKSRSIYVFYRDFIYVI